MADQPAVSAEAPALVNGVQDYFSKETNQWEKWDGNKPAENGFVSQEISTEEWSAAIQIMNNKRLQVGSDNLLLWDNNLAKRAQDWAEQVAISDPDPLTPASHSHGPDGENLHWTRDPKGMTLSQAVAGNEVGWIDEESKYHNEPGFNMATGHFAQCVWNDSWKFGAGRARGKSGRTYICGRFAPPGNYNKQWPNKTYEENWKKAHPPS